MNAIDAATEGSPYHGSNFKTKFERLNSNGNFVVSYEGQEYIAKDIGRNYPVKGQSVYMRVGHKHRTVNH